MKNEFIYLSEVSQLVGRLLPKRSPILLAGRVDSGKYRYAKFFNALRDRSFASEDSLASDLFGTTATSSDFKTLRSQVKRLLLNSLFHLDLRSVGPLAQMDYKNSKLVFAAKILEKFGMRRYAAALARNALPVAEKYEFTVNEFECLQILRYEASFRGKERQYEQLTKRQIEVLRILRFELEASVIRDRLMLVASGKRGTDKRSKEIATESMIELEDIYRQCPRFLTGSDNFRVKSSVYQLRGDFGRLLTVCDEADAFLAKYPHKVTRQPAEFLAKRLLCYTELHDLPHGLATARKCLEYYSRDDNWFVIKEYEFRLQIFSLNFEESRRILEDVLAHPRWAAQLENRRQKWQLVEYYLLFATGELTPQSFGLVSAERRALRLPRELPIYSRDKTGYNVALIVLQLLILLDARDYSAIVERIEALRVYINRYLRGPGTEQSAIFLRMLMLLEKESFDQAAVQEAALPALKLLQSSQFENPVMQGFQILPYEWIWNRIVSRL